VKRTKHYDKKLDWSKHEFIIKKHGGVDLETYELKIPDSLMFRVKFTLTDNKTLITGDYGTWTICRMFAPSADGFVSVIYWLEKMRIESEQVLESWDSDLTVEAIAEYWDEIKDESDDTLKEMYSRMTEIAELSENEEVYYHLCQDEGIDTEDIISEKKLNPHIEIIFDAFNEMCRRCEGE